MNRLKKLFSDYVRGKSTEQEKKIIDLWFDEKGRSSNDSVTDDEAEQFSQRIWKEFLVKKPKGKRHWNPRVTYGLIAAAAVVLLMILLNFPIKDSGSYGDLEQQNIAIGVTRQFVTDDDMKKITLVDGSVIYMNKESTIVLRRGGFNAYTREVWLNEGEAFFEVTKDPGRPFIVHTMDGLSTRVLGTSFNIKAYRQLGEQVISVKTGRVQVSNETGEKVVLDVNHKATFHAETQQLTAGTTDGAGAADWRNGRIVLEHVRMNELAFRLTQYYDVKVVNNAVPEEMEIYTSFYVGTPLEHVANNIADIFEVSYKIENDTIYFY